MALENQGLVVQRIAIRGWSDKIVDPQDQQEREKTEYVLRAGGAGVARAVLATMLGSLPQFLSALALATRMSRRAERSLLYHWIYLAEACVIARMIKRSGAAHLHAHFGTNPAEVVMLVQALTGVPYSFTVHGPEEFDRPQFIGIAEKIRRAAFVVAISSYGRSQLYRWIDHTQWDKIQVVHCGLEAAFHLNAPIAPASNARLVCVGRLCEQKGQLLLVQAARLVRDRGIDFELVLAGDGEMRPEIEALIRETKLERHIRITGWISSDQVREEILKSRAMVLPSFAEGLPVVIMEAMVLRRPVLSTYVAGIPELVLPGECGWLFPAGDVEQLALAMQSCLETPADQLEAMGAKARERAMARHDINIETTRLSQLFREQPKYHRNGTSLA